MTTDRTHPALRRAPSASHAAAALATAVAIVSGVATMFVDAAHDRTRTDALLARTDAARRDAAARAPVPARDRSAAALAVVAAR